MNTFYAKLSAFALVLLASGCAHQITGPDRGLTERDDKVITYHTAVLNNTRKKISSLEGADGVHNGTKAEIAEKLAILKKNKAEMTAKIRELKRRSDMDDDAINKLNHLQDKVGQEQKRIFDAIEPLETDLAKARDDIIRIKSYSSVTGKEALGSPPIPLDSKALDFQNSAIFEVGKTKRAVSTVPAEPFMENASPANTYPTRAIE